MNEPFEWDMTAVMLLVLLLIMSACASAFLSRSASHLARRVSWVIMSGDRDNRIRLRVSPILATIV
jgi:hypothetical protein